MTWSLISFDEAVADLTGGQHKVQKSEVQSQGALRVIDQGQQPVAGYIDDSERAYRGPIPVVLFGDHTRIFKYVEGPFALGADGVKVLSPKGRLTAKFLYYYFQSFQIQSRGYSRHFKFLREKKVPDVHPDEQRRIVEILDQADALRKLRREADALAERILPALFYKMFGDPVRNEMGWEIRRLSDVTRVIHRYPTFYGVEYVSDGIPVARISDITEGGVLDRNLAAYVRVPKEFSDTFPLTILESKDIVMAVRGDTTGKLGFVPEELSGANISPNLIRISPESSQVRPEFLFSYLSLARSNLKRFITNTAKKSITAESLKGLPVLVPAVTLQDRFVETLRGTQKTTEAQQASHRKLEMLYSVLLHRAFTGELTARWREEHNKSEAL